MMEQLEEFLKKSPLFKSFSSMELQKLIEKSQVKTFDPHEVIIKFCQPGRFLGIMLEGEAEAIVTGKTGDRRQLGLIKQGDFLGEMSLLTGEPTSADVIAVEKCKIFLIPQEIFSTFLAVNPEAAKVMARTMTERLRSRAAYLKLNFREMKIITCYLGNGVSLCAIDHGRSVYTSMGLTPLERSIMSTGCGTLTHQLSFAFAGRKACQSRR